MLSRTMLLAALSLVGLPVTLLPAQSTIDPALYKHAVKVVPIEYPLEARQRHLQGHGVLLGDVDLDTGKVTSVRMEKSTGYRILDEAALGACRQWIFKPHFTRKFRVPVDYHLKKGI